MLRPLIDAARTGDSKALNALAGCTDRFLRIFSGSLSSSIRRAQGSTIDFVLEGLAEALSRLGEQQFATDKDFYAWAASHIRHKIIDAGRHETRKKRGGNPVLLGEHAEMVKSPDPTASQIACRQEVLDATGHALLELQASHPEEMEAVVLKIFEGHSWPELKDAMSLTSEKRARTLFAHGLELLRPRIEATLGADVIAEFLRS